MSVTFNRADLTATRRNLRASAPKAEKMVWARLRKSQCGARFRRQVSIDSWVLDFYCPELHLAIEVDGPTHNNDEAAERDVLRQQRIEELGIRFVRISNEQVYAGLADVMESIQAIVDQIKRQAR